jgi:hypothetical protein
VKLPITEGVYETSQSALHTAQKIDFGDISSPMAENSYLLEALSALEIDPCFRESLPRVHAGWRDMLCVL